MITVSEIIKYDNMSFDDYQRLEGKSFSFLKRERDGVAPPIKSTTKMQLGTITDTLLTGVGVVDISHEMYPIAKEIAHCIRQKFGSFLSTLEAQVSYSATFEHRGFKLRVKGRPDFFRFKQFIIDLKVCNSSNVDSVIDFLRYPDQQFGYGRMAEVPDAYLLIYRNVKKIPVNDRICIRHIPIAEGNLFWENKILEHGSVTAIS